VQPFESVARTVIGKFRSASDRPESTPFAASVSPLGNVPLASENVSSLLRRLCESLAERRPATPLLTAGFVTVIVGTDDLQRVVARRRCSPASSVDHDRDGETAVTIGVPESTPFEPSVRPLGKRSGCERERGRADLARLREGLAEWNAGRTRWSQPD